MVAHPASLTPYRVLSALIFFIVMPGGPFSLAFHGTRLLSPTIWIFAFYLYFLSRPRLLAVFASVTCALNLFNHLIYSFANHHQGLLLGVAIALLWIDRETATPLPAPITGKKNLLKDLHFYQARIFPFLFLLFLSIQSTKGIGFAYQDVKFPFSSSKSFAERIQQTPRWNDAILMAEPDYLVEALPYYVNNPLYFARGRRFGQWTSFTREFKQNLSLGELLNTAEQMHASTGKPVLILLQADAVKPGGSGRQINSYGRVFVWNAQESTRLASETQPVAHFTGAMTDEIYDVYEVK